MCEEIRLGSKGTFGVGKLKRAIAEYIARELTSGDTAVSVTCWHRPPHTCARVGWGKREGGGFADKCNKDEWDDDTGKAVAITRACKDIAVQLIENTATMELMNGDGKIWKPFVKAWMPEGATRDELIAQALPEQAEQAEE